MIMNIRKVTTPHVLWLLSIVVVAYLAYAISRSAAAGFGLRAELLQSQNDVNRLVEELPALTRESSNKATGGAIDAANPLRNGWRETKRAHDNVKSEFNVGMRKLNLPIRW